MATEFKREERYIVIKRKHLSKCDELSLRELITDIDAPTVECVVVESDWPEYETVWSMIEARITGCAPAAPDHSEDVRDMVPVAVTPHDPTHPYVRKLIGCGHGRLFSEPCVDCEVVGLMDEYKRAVKTVMRVRDRMRQIGRPMPGETS